MSPFITSKLPTQRRTSETRRRVRNPRLKESHSRKSPTIRKSNADLTIEVPMRLDGGGIVLYSIEKSSELNTVRQSLVFLSESAMLSLWKMKWTKMTTESLEKN